MDFLTEEEEYNTEHKKCQEIQKLLGSWRNIHYNRLKKDDIIYVVYWTASQRDMFTYKPLIGKIINIVVKQGIIEKIIILDQNNNETNILKCGFGYGFHHVGFCDMSISILSEIAEKKRKNEETTNDTDTKINKEDYDSDFFEISSSSETLDCEKIEKKQDDPYYVSESDTD